LSVHNRTSEDGFIPFDKRVNSVGRRAQRYPPYASAKEIKASEATSNLSKVLTF
jgi:hypothetical protein